MAGKERKTIRQLREERHWTQAELADRTHVSTAQVIHAETDYPDIALIGRMATAFGIEPEDITLSRRARLIEVCGYRFLIVHEGPDEARVTGIDPSGANERTQRILADESAWSPGAVLFSDYNRAWTETDPDPDTAIRRLADRIRATFEQAIER